MIGSLISTGLSIAGSSGLFGDDGGADVFDGQAAENAARVTYARAYKTAIGARIGVNDDTDARQVARLAIPPGSYVTGPVAPLFTVTQAASRWPQGFNGPDMGSQLTNSQGGGSPAPPSRGDNQQARGGVPNPAAVGQNWLTQQTLVPGSPNWVTCAVGYFIAKKARIV